jgi:hypothetical protein
VRAVPQLLKFGSKMVRLVEEGDTWIGDTGEPGFLFVLRHSDGLFQAALENRKEGVKVEGKPKLSPGAAAANLLRGVKGICRASGLRVL